MGDSFTGKKTQQQYQSRPTEGKDATKVKKTQKTQHKIQQYNKETRIYNPLVYNNSMG